MGNPYNPLNDVLNVNYAFPIYTNGEMRAKVGIDNQIIAELTILAKQILNDDFDDAMKVVKG